MIKLLVDCFGGDHSPQAPVAGALAALAKNPDLHLILTGDEAVLRKELEGKAYDPARLEIVHAPEIIGCDEKPTDVVRLKRNSSMMKAIILLRDNPRLRFADTNLNLEDNYAILNQWKRFRKEQVKRYRSYVKKLV